MSWSCDRLDLQTLNPATVSNSNLIKASIVLNSDIDHGKCYKLAEDRAHHWGRVGSWLRDCETMPDQGDAPGAIGYRRRESL